MKIAVCDDQQEFRSQLITLLEQFAAENDKVFFYYEYETGEEMLSSNIDFDLIFVDYMMHDLNGVDTIAALRNRNVDTHVIFVSSFPEIVYDTFLVDTFRFLKKPVEYPKLEEALLSFFQKIAQHKIIMIRNHDNSAIYRVPEESIIYAQADNVYTQVFTVRQSFTFSGTLSAFENLLTDSFFFRTHRSYIVNLHYIEHFTKTAIYFSTGEKAPIARTKYKSFFQTYCDFIKEKGKQML